MFKSLDYAFIAYLGSQGRQNGDSYIHNNNLFVVIDGVGGDYLGGGGVVFELFHHAGRPAGSKAVLPYNIYSCPRGLDVDVALHINGDLGDYRADIQYAPVFYDGDGAGADRGPVYLSGLVDRLVLGENQLGHMVGLGSAVNV